MNDFLGSSQFQNDLQAACQSAFRRYGSMQSEYESAEELAQDVVRRFIPWLPRYRKDAALKTVLTAIARNLLFDAGRRQKKRDDNLRRIDAADFDLDSLKGFSGTELEFRVLFRECLGKLSAQERHVLIENRLQRKSTRQLAEELSTTRPLVGEILKRAIAKFTDCIRK